MDKNLEDAFMTAYNALNALEKALHAQYRETKIGTYLVGHLKVYELYDRLMGIDRSTPKGATIHEPIS